MHRRILGGGGMCWASKGIPYGWMEAQAKKSLESNFPPVRAKK